MMAIKWKFDEIALFKFTATQDASLLTLSPKLSPGISFMRK